LNPSSNSANEFHAFSKRLQRTTSVMAEFLGWLRAGVIFGAAVLFTSRLVVDAKHKDCGTAKERIAAVDNMKALLMFMVIFMQLLGQNTMWRELPLGPGVHCFLNSFPVRAFAFISGMHTGGAKPAEPKNIFTRLVLPLFLFAVALGPLTSILADVVAPPHQLLSAGSQFDRMERFLFHARGPVWYLVALIAWKIWGALLHETTPVVQMGIACLMSFLAGHAGKLGGGTDVWNRAFDVFPVFIAGRHLPVRAALDLQPSLAQRALAIPLLLALFSLEQAASTADIMEHAPNYVWGAPSDGYGAALLCALNLFRDALEVNRALLFLLFVCPKGSGMLSEFGKHSLAALLVHMPFMPGLYKIYARMCLRLEDGGYEVLGHELGPRAGGLAAWMCCVVVVAPFFALCSSQLCQRLTAPFLEPLWLERLLVAPAGARKGAADVA